jgi:hypothetical protein
MPTTNAAGQYPGGQSTASQVLLSQSLMSSGGMKAANQVSMLQYFFFLIDVSGPVYNLFARIFRNKPSVC